MATPIFTLKCNSLGIMSWDKCCPSFDTNADVDMAYDFVCEQLGIDSFVDNEADGMTSTLIGKQQTIVTKPNTTFLTTIMLR